MKHLRLITFSTASFIVTAGLVVAACSSDDTVVPGTDAGPVEAGTDVKQPPGEDASTDAPNDNNVDTDAGLTTQNFFRRVAEEVCGALTQCCFGKSDVPDGGAVDGGTYNAGKCVGVYRRVGFESSNIGVDAILPTNVEIDQVKGKECLEKIDKLVCNQTGATLQDVRAACFAAIKGKVTNGADCRTTMECATGLFCNPVGATPDGGAVDAGPDGGAGGTIIGKCAPLRTQGQSCNIFDTGNDDNDSQTNEDACSYRGSGAPPLRCDSYDFGAGAYKPRNQWTCQPTVSNGQGCNFTSWCKDGICNPENGYKCESPLKYFGGPACSFVLN
jgi:hypothetical protein